MQSDQGRGKMKGSTKHNYDSATLSVSLNWATRLYGGNNNLSAEIRSCKSMKYL